SLSEVLYNLSAVIRARFRLRRKVQALSSEAKSSAAIIGALPVLVTLGLYAARPEYVGILFIVPKGQVFLGGAIFWMFLGCLMMRQMINFRI
ncbi:MAG: pilus assembly protein, partial [Alphaproteobacteria bacterium]|nr:pilus assembly protein [Alphaproteobacteria bacterium]